MRQACERHEDRQQPGRVVIARAGRIDLAALQYLVGDGLVDDVVGARRQGLCEREQQTEHGAKRHDYVGATSERQGQRRPALRFGAKPEGCQYVSPRKHASGKAVLVVVLAILYV